MPVGDVARDPGELQACFVLPSAAAPSCKRSTDVRRAAARRAVAQLKQPRMRRQGELRALGYRP
jgi:hypothetical protein